MRAIKSWILANARSLPQPAVVIAVALACMPYAPMLPVLSMLWHILNCERIIL